MPEPKRPLKVFLCHAHADRDPVRGLYTRLTQDGVDAWLDKEKLLPGQDWELEVREAVREADVVVVCLSKQFNQAGFRQQEVRWALDTAMKQPEDEIFIIPARLEECDNLESLIKWHWVDLFEEDGYEMLMQALRIRVEKIGAVLKVQENSLLQTPILHIYQNEQNAVERDESTVGFTASALSFHTLFELSSYRIKVWLSYGVAIALGLLPIVFLNSDSLLVFLAAVFFFPGVWAVATNRRWVFLAAFSTLITVILLEAGMNMSDLLILAPFLIFGLFVDVFLFQVGIAKRFYIKALWSSVAGAILIILLLAYGFIGTQATTSSEYVIVCLSSFTSFLVISYVGMGFAHFIRNIWPKIFEDSLSFRDTNDM